jgi:Mrp family chromosome partitioning ATPase
MADKNCRILGVTSPMPRCGKTTVAINLAISVAQLTAPLVLLGDLDLRRPKVGEYLGLRPQHGFSDYLEGRIPVEAALVNPGVPRLLVLPNKKPCRDAAEMLASPAMESLSDLLRSEDGDRVNILDLPPMLPTDETITVLPRVDCVLLVVEEGATSTQEVEDTLRLLDRTPLVGVVLNKYDTTRQHAYY